MSLRSLITALVLIVLIPGARAVADTALPRAVVAKHEMVVTANPLATAAGAQILKAGGTAADAMIAVQTVLGLVEPQSSGLGGGAFIIYYAADTGRLTTIDAREKAPAAARESRFLDAEGQPMDFFSTWQSGLAVGVPGVPRMLESMHQRFGKLPWQDLFVQAINLARSGFSITERTSSQVADLLQRNTSCAEQDRLFFRDPATFKYFVDGDNCTAKPAGTQIRNKAYADLLTILSRKGAAGFYQGDIAQDIVAAVQGDRNRPGDMTVHDLMNYHVIEREPVCSSYQNYQVCGMGPPSSGGLAVGQILAIMDHRPDLQGVDPLDVATVHLLTQAGRLAFADRARYVADSDFVSVPVAGLLDQGYLTERARLITSVDMGHVTPGDPPGSFSSPAPDSTIKNSGTSHISIIDRYGNALSMTSSIESSFGNGVMVHGILLNNQLTDFSFTNLDQEGNPIANRVQPNKRPRSSMSPTIVLDAQGRVVLLTGSPGGSRIIGYTAQSLMNILGFGLDPQEAINVPHFMNRNDRTDLEQPLPGVTLDYPVDTLKSALRERHHKVGMVAQTSGLSIIQIKRVNGESFYIGGADRRRDGTVGGR